MNNSDIKQLNVEQRIIDRATELTIERALASVLAAKWSGVVTIECVALVTASVALGVQPPRTVEKPYMHKDLANAYPPGTWPHILRSLGQISNEGTRSPEHLSFILRSVSDALCLAVNPVIESSDVEHPKPTAEWLRERFPQMVERSSLRESCRSPIREACAAMVCLLIKAGYSDVIDHDEYLKLIDELRAEMIGAFAAKHQGRCDDKTVDEIGRFLHEMQMLCMNSIKPDDAETSFAEIQAQLDGVPPTQATYEPVVQTTSEEPQAEQPAETYQATSNNSMTSADDDDEDSTSTSKAARKNRHRSRQHPLDRTDRTGCVMVASDLHR